MQRILRLRAGNAGEEKKKRYRKAHKDAIRYSQFASRISYSLFAIRI